MSSRGVWIAGSYRSDYARNYAREGLEISDMIAEAVAGTLDSGKTNPEDVTDAKGARIAGWGHGTAGLSLQAKFDRSHGQPYVFPHVRQVVKDAFRRAHLADVTKLDGIETHDCFSMSEYMAVDHFGITGPGERED
jgi:hypothetical protein